MTKYQKFITVTVTNTPTALGQKVVAAYQAGATLEEVAKKFNMTNYRQAQEVLKRLGVARRAPKRPARLPDEHLLSLYRKHRSCHKVAQQSGYAVSSVYQRLTKLGIGDLRETGPG